MITKFKLFEQKGDKFKIGTYVLLDQDPDNGWNVYPYVKIIDRESTKTHDDPDEYPLNDYEVESFSLETGEIKTFWVDDIEIERELTPDEIIEKINQIKYNI